MTEIPLLLPRLPSTNTLAKSVPTTNRPAQPHYCQQTGKTKQRTSFLHNKARSTKIAVSLRRRTHMSLAKTQQTKMTRISSDVLSSDSEDTAISTPSKAKRGRPPKDAVNGTNSSDAEEAVASPTLKRKVGRPSKNVVKINEDLRGKFTKQAAQ
ncbi:hypothetical protein K432DRAFT_404285 [Lepidopterella palustris CBS 459.81]|uniref:Uncharacterized protein n=1 Tax=Lepidopterella palustris CBS 459.81 TaxID=1314670 RepID=A0A8E2EBF7_9PEZI|nr:hypothetical protein K432DRAFT_404285 [Lepidopterella palustris CBS 459.81]